jgi:hypothetical protein
MAIQYARVDPSMLLLQSLDTTTAKTRTFAQDIHEVRAYFPFGRRSSSLQKLVAGDVSLSLAEDAVLHPFILLRFDEMEVVTASLKMLMYAQPSRVML